LARNSALAVGGLSSTGFTRFDLETNALVLGKQQSILVAVSRMCQYSLWTVPDRFPLGPYFAQLWSQDHHLQPCAPVGWQPMPFQSFAELLEDLGANIDDGTFAGQKCSKTVSLGGVHLVIHSGMIITPFSH
jgi:hypothetical protein